MSNSPNTALLSLPPLRPSPSKQNSFTRSSQTTATKRSRSSSIVSVQEVPETYDDQLDQGALTNVNADWVNYKGEPLDFISGDLPSHTRRSGGWQCAGRGRAGCTVTCVWSDKHPSDE